ncbi:tetratricopeptide repeat protein, partial [Micromonospora sp. KC721]|uniref:tetratricopeptide repeat protein n=1 Tax=Micromonospora sp. KC721 TaxID=2530380 RepID=UPI0010450845
VVARGLGEPEHAADLLTDALAYAGRTSHPLLTGMAGTLRGFVALDMGDCDTAERDARAVLTAVEPHNPQAPAQVAPRVLLATARLAAGDPATAVGLLAPVATTASSNPTLLFSRRQTMARYASALLAHGQREQALDWARRAVAAPAEDVRSQVIGASVLAEALAACGQPVEAVASAEEAVRLAYATEQRSERAAADALHIRLTTP